MEDRAVASDPILMPAFRGRVVVVDAHPVLAIAAGPVFPDGAAFRFARDLTRPDYRTIRLAHVPFAEPKIELPEFRGGACRWSRSRRLSRRDDADNKDCHCSDEQPVHEFA